MTHINGAAPGSAAWQLGIGLITAGAAGAGGNATVAAAETTVGNAILNGFDDKDAGALTQLGTVIGGAAGVEGGPPGMAIGAAIGAAIGYAIGGMVGGASDNASVQSIGGNNGFGSLAHGGRT